MADQNLAIALRAGADADRRDLYACADPPREIAGNGFENNREDPRLLEYLRILHEPVCGFRIPGLRTKATELMHRLRRQSKVSHHRYSDIDQPFRRIDNLPAAFDFHGGPSPFL